MTLNAIPVDARCPHCKKDTEISVNRLFLQDIKEEMLVCMCSRCRMIIQILLRSKK